MMLQDLNEIADAGDLIALTPGGVPSSGRDRHNLYQRLGWPEWFVIALLPELTRLLGFISPQMGILGVVPVVGIAGMV